MNIFFLRSIIYINYSQTSAERMCQVVKNNGKSLTVGRKKWSWLLTGGGRLLEISTVTVRLWLGKVWCFGLVVVYGTWSRIEVWLYKTE